MKSETKIKTKIRRSATKTHGENQEENVYNQNWDIGDQDQEEQNKQQGFKRLLRLRVNTNSKAKRSWGIQDQDQECSREWQKYPDRNQSQKVCQKAEDQN